MSSAMNEVSELTSQISTYETEIAELERKAKSLQAEVDILQKNKLMEVILWKVKQWNCIKRKRL